MSPEPSQDCRSATTTGRSTYARKTPFGTGSATSVRNGGQPRELVALLLVMLSRLEWGFRVRGVGGFRVQLIFSLQLENLGVSGSAFNARGLKGLAV